MPLDGLNDVATAVQGPPISTTCLPVSPLTALIVPFQEARAHSVARDTASTTRKPWKLLRGCYLVKLLCHVSTACPMQIVRCQCDWLPARECEPVVSLVLGVHASLSFMRPLHRKYDAVGSLRESTGQKAHNSRVSVRDLPKLQCTC